MALSMHKDSANKHMDTSKYVRYTPEQVEALERVYSECPKPSSLRRQQLIRECPILSNIEPKQIKVWFQNRRCREKQRKEASRLQTVNRKLTAMNKLLMEENDRLQKQVSHLVYDNGYMRQQLQSASGTTTDNSCESVVMSGQQQQQQNPTPQHPQRDANNPAGLLAIAEEALAEFLSKATGTAVDWVQMIGMKPGPDSIGIVAVSRNCSGVAARACGLVSLEPTKVAEILKDCPSWFRDCRCLDVLSAIPTGNGGTIELIYMQTYAPTTLAAARDFWMLRYTASLDDGSLVICVRSLTTSTGGPSGPPNTSFVRAEMLPSGYLIRPCEGGGSIIHIVDHVDLDAWSVPEVLRPLYESSKILAQKMTIAALRHIRQIAQETSGEIQYGGGRQPAVLRTFSQRLCRGFNDAVNGFADDGWSLLGSDGVEDVTIMVNSSPSKFLGSQYSTSMFSTFGGGVLCAKASMLLQNVPPALLVRFLREHRSEWADYGVDAYSAACLRASPFAVPCARPGGFPGSQVILPLAHTVEHEEFLEVVRLEGHAFSPEDVALARDMYLLQLCSGVDENAVGASAQLVFAPIDESFADDAPLLPSGFRVIPLDPKTDGPAATRTLDLASTLEVGAGGARPASEADLNSYNLRSVLTIAFQFTFENHLRDNVAAMARQYVRSVVGSVQRVAMAISPSRLSSHAGPKPLPGSPEALTLAQWICRGYRVHTGGELFQVDSQAGDAILKQLWHHSDAILCCSVKTNASPVFTFANQAGLDMLETTLVALQDIMLDKILDEAGRKILCSEFSKIMQQGFAYLPAGLCVSSMGRPLSYPSGHTLSPSFPMKSPSSPYGGRKSTFGALRTPERVPYSPSSAYSDVSTAGTSSSSGRSRVAVAARSVAGVFVACFTPPETKSSTYSVTDSEEFKAPSVASDGSRAGSERRRSSNFGGYAGSNNSTHVREPGRVQFAMEDILKATRNFSPSFKIGQGGFGTVYKGRLEDGTVVAVKRAKKSVYDKHLGVEFQSEIRTLAQVEHLNLVRFYGCLEHQDERIVVVEYVPNGTLREHLDCIHVDILDLAARLEIAIDVAHAITYLHMYTDHPIIHRDIKSSNILLTENLRAKVADFGFARMAADSDSGATHVSTQVKGTAGYLDPEYLRTYQLTEKSDVYSFGVLLVELVTGRRPIETKRELKERITARWAMKKFTDGDAISVLDPKLECSAANHLALEKILELAAQCLAPHRQNRPRMRMCAEILWSIRKDYRELSASDFHSLSLSDRSERSVSIKE